MASYQPRIPGATLPDAESAARQTAGGAASFLQRLIPFPASGMPSPLSLLPMPGTGRTERANPVNDAADVAGTEASSIVSQAASILDEEMARGVLAASRSAPAPHGYQDATNPVLRQVHDFIDSVAAGWPGMHGLAPRLPGAPQPAPVYADPVAEVRPRETVKPGQRATISMTVRNSENRPVCLVPAATDLIGSRDGRIPCSQLQFMPAEVRLDPQEQRDLTIATTVPAGTPPGCYSGLLVVRGIDYLRALITIEVA